MAALAYCPFPRKRRYVNEDDALRVVRALDGPARAYICPSERHWHITSEVGKLAKPRKPVRIKQWRRSAEAFRAKVGR